MVDKDYVECLQCKKRYLASSFSEHASRYEHEAVTSYCSLCGKGQHPFAFVRDSLCKSCAVEFLVYGLK